jgi:hypothetical protein
MLYFISSFMQSENTKIYRLLTIGPSINTIKSTIHNSISFSTGRDEEIGTFDTCLKNKTYKEKFPIPLKYYNPYSYFICPPDPYHFHFRSSLFTWMPLVLSRVWIWNGIWTGC